MDVVNNDDDDVIVVQYFKIQVSANIQASCCLALIAKQKSEPHFGSTTREL